jgi:hypothetical protein
MMSGNEAAGQRAQSGQLGSSAGTGGQSAKDPSDVAVESGSGLIKSDAGDGPGGVVANPREFL